MPDYGDDKGFGGSGGGGGGKSGGGGGGQDRSGMKETLDKYREEKGGGGKDTPKSKPKKAGPKQFTSKPKSKPTSSKGGGGTDRQQAFGAKARQVSTVDSTSPETKTDRQLLAESAVKALSPSKVDMNPTFDEGGNVVNDASLPNELAAASVDGPLTQSQFERIMEITDVDPYGKGSMSTSLGRGMKKGIASLSDFLGKITGKNINLETSYPDLSQTKKDFLKNTAYDKYLDPFGQGKVLTNMKNYNLTDEEQAEYDAAAKAQGTSSPMKVMTEYDYAKSINAPNVESYAPTANKIRSGLSKGDLTQYGLVDTRPRNISGTEMAVRGAFAATPLGVPLGILSEFTDVDKIKGIKGMPDQITGQPFQPAPSKSFIERVIDLGTAGVGSTALSTANQAAQDLLSGQGIFNTTTAQSLPSATEVMYGGDVPNTGLPGSVKSRQMQKLQNTVSPYTSIGIMSPSDGLNTDNMNLVNNKISFGGGGGSGGDGPDPILLPTDIEPEEVQDDTNTTQPMNTLFAQEMYGGPQGQFIVPAPNYGISALPTNRTNRPAKFTV